jgi:hypothetical protein
MLSACKTRLYYSEIACMTYIARDEKNRVVAAICYEANKRNGRSAILTWMWSTLPAAAGARKVLRCVWQVTSRGWNKKAAFCK